jgi:predicted GTPase
MAMMTTANDPLLPRVRLLLEKTAALAQASGDPDAENRLRAELAKPPAPRTSVMVVGENKRGKSSLLNALLGQPGLLPVDTDVATSGHLAITHADKPGARVSAVSEAGDEHTVEIPLESIGTYASMAGNPDNVQNVRAVEIGLDHPLLARGLTLVDTPGVGGLEAGHTAITLAQLPYADALVFVLDPNAPMTAPELAFLEEATKRIETVLFVLTKTDAFPGWPKIVEDNRELIAARAPRFAQCRSCP